MAELSFFSGAGLLLLACGIFLIAIQSVRAREAERLNKAFYRARTHRLTRADPQTRVL